jgi:hypothetical protein
MKNDYPKILLRRARFAAPRELAEEVATVMQERNAACLSAWRQRWAKHWDLPDAYNQHWRHFFTLYYEAARQRARIWLTSRPSRRRKVLTIYGEAL